MDKKQWALKIAVILAGSILSAYGITLAMYAGFGSATLAVLWQGISKVTGMSIGMASFAVAAVMIVFVWFYDRSQIHIVLLGGSFGVCTIVTVLVSGPVIQATVQGMNKFVLGGK